MQPIVENDKHINLDVNKDTVNVNINTKWYGIICHTFVGIKISPKHINNTFLTIVINKVPFSVKSWFLFCQAEINEILFCYNVLLWKRKTILKFWNDFYDSQPATFLENVYDMILFDVIQNYFSGPLSKMEYYSTHSVVGISLKLPLYMSLTTLKSILSSFS